MDHDPTKGRGKPAAHITPDDMMVAASALVRAGQMEGGRYLMVAAQRLKAERTYSAEQEEAARVALVDAEIAGRSEALCAVGLVAQALGLRRAQ